MDSTHESLNLYTESYNPAAISTASEFWEVFTSKWKKNKNKNKNKKKKKQFSVSCVLPNEWNFYTKKWVWSLLAHFWASWSNQFQFLSNLAHSFQRRQLLICFLCGCLTPWRNGSASDSRSEGCVFKSRRGQIFLVIRNNILTALINLLANKTSSVTGLEPAIPRSEVWCLIH